MKSTLLFIIALLCGFLIHILADTFIKLPGTRLRKNFSILTEKSEGNITGKTYHEISAVCGPAHSVFPGHDGTSRRLWTANGYQLVLLFDANDVCLGVVSEEIT